MKTLDELTKVLAGAEPGQATHISYDVYALLFPPGELDEGARERAHEFAKKNGCVIDRRHLQREVLFVKKN
jgi:hypothetical protein